MRLNANELEKKLHQEIPLSQFMQVHVAKANEVCVELTCPLAPNHNHLGTAFGGSLSCLMILTAYCQIFRMIEDQGHVLLKSHRIDFFHPVSSDLRAVCQTPEEPVRENFLKTYQKKGKAQLELKSQIVLENGLIACEMRAVFVGINSPR